MQSKDVWMPLVWPAITALLNLVLAMFGKRDTALGRAVAKVGVDPIPGNADAK